MENTRGGVELLLAPVEGIRSAVDAIVAPEEKRFAGRVFDKSADWMGVLELKVSFQV